ncbi:GNAT family N-acetyltransferase [Hoeflea alexandrii]|uniref:GNAT family N-acetyltransferase n=1 Tax=Hoeflea alexandrii TaxID=288436 RepID=UPI0022AE55CC|nr:GNAT family N-acetyltransferase [Hoeflea alexandrii]MCZ4290282.1 GNAT family N-acetyltransferase [Hoeflea alexandrii]
MSSALRPAFDTPSVRRATVEDLPACAAIINDYMDDTFWLQRVTDRRTIERMFAADLLDRRIIFVAEEDSGIIGYMSMDHNAGFIHGLYLRPWACGHGLGKTLLDAAKNARPQGFELEVFEPNTDALRFYMREGLVEVPGGRREVSEEGIPTLRLRWQGSAQ